MELEKDRHNAERFNIMWFLTNTKKTNRNANINFCSLLSRLSPPWASGMENANRLKHEKRFNAFPSQLSLFLSLSPYTPHPLPQGGIQLRCEVRGCLTLIANLHSWINIQWCLPFLPQITVEAVDSQHHACVCRAPYRKWLCCFTMAWSASVRTKIYRSKYI